MIIDGGSALLPDTRPDAPEDVPTDLGSPDLRTPDRYPDRIVIIDGGPAIPDANKNTAPKDAIDARDTAADQQGPDGALDGANDSQGDV